MVHVTQVVQVRQSRASFTSTLTRQTSSLLLFNAGTNEAMLLLAAAKHIVDKIDYQRPMTFHHAPPANNQTAR